MKKQLFTFLLLALAAYGQQERIAIIQTMDNRDSIGISELAYLTDRLRETAVNILPKQRYGVMTTESIVAFLGSQENARKVCNESSCLAEIGRKVNADYVAQAHIGRFGKNLTIKTELYSSKSGNLLGSFTGESKDISGLLAIIDKKASDLFGKMPGLSGGARSVSPSFAGGIGGVQTTGGDYELEGGKTYLANIATEPDGAFLSFDGAPDSRCAKTPCKAILAEGSVRIVAVLEQYEKADTTVSIRQNNQSINIRLKANFGVLEIKPAYADGIGKDDGWSLTINGRASSYLENRLSPGRHSVELSHRCYEAISFNAGINKDRREVFDMAGYIKLKKGGLVLNAEKDGEPVSEPVFVNGKQAGETPFSGTVPLCAGIELGKGREKVEVKLKHNEKVSHTHKGNRSLYASNDGKLLIDDRDGKKYRPVQIGKQMWMAENLNYDASGSLCYGNNPDNCDKYGRLYDWNTAKKACPKGWHLPSKPEWDVLTAAVGGNKTEGKHLKARFGWNDDKGKSGNGTDAYGFSALPGGSYYDGYSNPVGRYGYWWAASEGNAYYAYYRSMSYDIEGAYWDDIDKSNGFSVRCLQD